MSRRDGHLGEVAAALVDGALDGDTRDRALAHVAGCTACRSEVEQQRRCKDRLRRLAGPDLPAGLADRLRAVAGPGGPDAAPVVPPAPMAPVASVAHVPQRRPVPARGRRNRVAAARRPGGATRLADRRPASRPVARHSRRVAGGVTALALGLLVVTLGPTRHQGPAVSPPVGQFVVDHAQTTGGFPGADPAAGAVMTVSVNR